MKTCSSLMTAAALVAATGAPAVAPKKAPVPAAEPFAMRGVRLGITIDEFKALPIATDEGETEPLTACSNEPMPDERIRIENMLDSDREAGMVTCQWFARTPYLSSRSYDRHFIDLGTGKGQPSFEFISDGTNYRLFRISFFANNQYHTGILDALTRNYGPPKVLNESFQTRSGASFPNTTSIWSNGSSTIILDQRCIQADRYCLTYSHHALGRIYKAARERLAASQAGKI